MARCPTGSSSSPESVAGILLWVFSAYRSMSCAEASADASKGHGDDADGKDCMVSIEDRRARERRGDIEPERRRSYAVACTKCGAQCGSACMGVSGERWAFHAERVKAGRLNRKEWLRQGREGAADWRAQERRLQGLDEPDAGHFNRPGVDPHTALHGHYRRLGGIASQAASITAGTVSTRPRGPEVEPFHVPTRDADMGR